MCVKVARQVWKESVMTASFCARLFCSQHAVFYEEKKLLPLIFRGLFWRFPAIFQLVKFRFGGVSDEGEDLCDCLFLVVNISCGTCLAQKLLFWRRSVWLSIIFQLVNSDFGGVSHHIALLETICVTIVTHAALVGSLARDTLCFAEKIALLWRSKYASPNQDCPRLAQTCRVWLLCEIFSRRAIQKKVSIFSQTVFKSKLSRKMCSKNELDQLQEWQQSRRPFQNEACVENCSKTNLRN